MKLVTISIFISYYEELRITPSEISPGRAIHIPGDVTQEHRPFSLTRVESYVVHVHP